MRVMKLSDIKISDEFASTNPSKFKMDRYRDMWDKFNRQPKYIVVNDNNVLIDGYIQYLLLKEKGFEDGECLVRHSKNGNKTTYRNTITTYVYGVHPNSNCDKEFIWRVPKSMTWFAENVQVGDSILCQTKFGIAPVIVTRVEVLDKCPVDFRVKKVASKEIRRGEYTVIP